MEIMFNVLVVTLVDSNVFIHAFKCFIVMLSIFTYMVISCFC